MSTAHSSAHVTAAAALGQMLGVVELAFDRGASRQPRSVTLPEPAGTILPEWERLRTTGFAGMTPLLQRVTDLSSVPDQTLLWCTRWHHPVTCLFLLYCHTESSSVGRWLDGLVPERDIVKMGTFALSMRERRLVLGGARSLPEFLEALRQAAAAGGRVRVIGDWRLDEEEWAAAKAAVADSEVDLGELLVGPDLPTSPADLKAGRAAGPEEEEI